ncbi:uncharacterized protein METZ01_LOCUS288247 [marine metagenome]|uniref:Uncharacterized protein n=1 Tax=marine metagenome TaxID=408172 RepID=A0A382LGT4_9ZZZZ
MYLSTLFIIVCTSGLASFNPGYDSDLSRPNNLHLKLQPNVLKNILGTPT